MVVRVFRESWREWLSSNYRGWRILVGSLCAICLALVSHFREVRLEVLDLNAVAGRCITAQVDFEFPDYDTTRLLQKQAMLDIGKVYQIDDQKIRQARYHLEDLLIHSKQWKQSAPSSSFEDIYKAGDAVETELMEARLLDRRTAQKIRDLQVPEFSYFSFFPDGATLAVLLPAEFWPHLREQMIKKNVFSSDAITYVIEQFQEMQWSLVEDTALGLTLQQKIAKTVPEKFTKVYAGTRLINPGDIVTSRHLAMMQAMKQAIAESRHLSEPLSWLSSILLSFIFVVISGLYFRISQPDFVRSLRRISLFICIVIITLVFAKLTEYILLESSPNLMGDVNYPIWAPFATLLICILLSPRTALFGATFLSIILSISLAMDPSRVLILNLVTSMTMIICSQKLRRRKEIFGVCLKSAASAVPVLYSFQLSENHLWSSAFVGDVGASLAFLMITAILVIGLIPALEAIFGVLTDMSLVEYMDPNGELLRTFAATVPGTYQHSLVLGNLAETCARTIGANGLFCRSATLYHDIGKMNNPQFYTENQQTDLNMHHLLTPKESAQVIISHVTDGIEMARKYRLPESFVDIIKEHHGTTLVYYFYRKELDLKLGCKEKVREKDFRYLGPKPKTKESAIIMICDSVEAASRSVDPLTEEALSELVGRIISEKAEDGQFDDCELTFEDLSKIKKSLIKALLIIHHVRIKYPERI